MTNASISSRRLFIFFFNELTTLKSCIKQPHSCLKTQKIEIKFNLEISFYTVFIGKLQNLHLFKSSRPGTFINNVFSKISQNSLENTCAGVSFIIMLLTVASIPCREYIKYKILTHVPVFLSSKSFLFCFLSQRSDLPFENFILHLHCGVDIRGYSEEHC